MDSIFIEAGALTKLAPALYMGKDTNAHIQGAVDRLLTAFGKVAVIGFAPYAPPADHEKRGNIVVANYDGSPDFLTKIDTAVKGFKDVGLVVNGLSEFQAIILAKYVPDGQTAEIKQYGQAVDSILARLRSWQIYAGGFIVTADVATSINLKTQQLETDINVMPAVRDRLRTLLPDKVFYALHSKPSATGGIHTVTRQDNPALAMRFIAAQPN